jgi:hypothetical protein
MKIEEINKTNVVKNINTTFQESLKSWIILTYLFSSNEKRFWWITVDWQYRFILLKKWDSLEDLDFWETKNFWDFLDDWKDKTLESIIEASQDWFWYIWIHFQLWWHILEPLKLNLDNINEIDNFLIELKKSKTKWDINNVLD